MQLNDESIVAYITRLKILIKDCDYEDQRDKELRDQIVFGCLEDKLRQKFFEAETLTLKRTIDLCVTYQASRRQMDVYKDGKSKQSTSLTEHETIAKVGKWKPRKNKPPKKSSTQPESTSQKDSTPKSIKVADCKYCGNKHQWKKTMCPAYGQICGKCKAPNHFSSMCMTKKVHSLQSNEQEGEMPESDDSEVEYLLKLSSSEKKKISG